MLLRHHKREGHVANEVIKRLSGGPSKWMDGNAYDFMFDVGQLLQLFEVCDQFTHGGVICFGSVGSFWGLPGPLIALVSNPS